MNNLNQLQFNQFKSNNNIPINNVTGRDGNYISLESPDFNTD